MSEYPSDFITSSAVVDQYMLLIWKQGKTCKKHT